MYLYKEAKETGKYIIYSNYGTQSHIIINNYGVPFTVNTTGVVYDSAQKAEDARTEFYIQIAEVQDLIKIESHESF